MKDEKYYKSDAFAAIHESMDVLYQIGAISKKTMREFDEFCLTPIIEMPAKSIKALRGREQVSQPVMPPTSMCLGIWFLTGSAV